MHPEVCRHFRSRFVCLIAPFEPTFVRFLVRMASPVYLQIVFGDAALIAKFTRKWRVLGVHILSMPVHLGSPLETRPTVLADKLLSAVVLPPVTLQRSLQPKPRRAIVALECVLQPGQLLFGSPFIVRNSDWLF